MGSGTNIGRVRGLGSAQEGAHHWIVQRVTAVSNLLLVLWLVISLVRLPNFEHELLVEWIGFIHFRGGVQVLIEDYVPDHGVKFGLIVLLNFFALGGASLGIFSVAKIAFTGVVA